MGFNLCRPSQGCNHVEVELVTDRHQSFAASQELINRQCLQCGSVTTGNVSTIGECPRCGALDYHVFRGLGSIDETAHYRRPGAPDNKDVNQ